jgi:glycosyltransferase involved in cell wall biosynthesis
MTRIAFTLIGGKSWTGGYNYLLNLLQVITKRRPGALQPVLFFGTDVDLHDAAPFRLIEGVEIITSPLMNRSRRNASLLRSLILGADPATRRMFHKHGINVVFENAQFFGWRLNIPAIAWIPDFQHRELPQLFPHFFWWKRELGFRIQIIAGRTIMLSSDDARKTCERHYPSTIGRTQVVRFAVSSAGRPDDVMIRSMREIYNLPKRYIYMPNQFWQHKNHLLVIEALVLLKEANHNVIVVTTGKQYDPNRPDHFERIARRITEAGIADQFLLLGLVPYEHVAPLMTGSLALLNPSKFEGWSTTVEEARALKVPMLLSDIPVHREQAGDIANFFDPINTESLADKLLDVWHEKSLFLPFDALQASQFDPVQQFADDFVDLALLIAKQHRNYPKVTL